ncbi:OmpA family protein [Arenibaculum pallidiluteum]|uniref:OmpA family protein n=1 Tax=Arenibaculum pallidiluteum TaxID=2812559 RepID=UPI002E296610|nr:OmpA family protein [Arenibaculum pallidiluteum]
MQRNFNLASSAFALVALATAFGAAPASAQTAATVCNPLLDSSSNPVFPGSATPGPVIHSFTVPCPPVAAAVAPAPAPAPAPQQRVQDSVYFVFFDFDRSNITPAAQDIINTVIADFRRNNAAGVNVVGHTDTSGSTRYNQRLSERRASSVRDSLVRGGVPTGVIATSGRGESQPLIATGDGVREPSNRRAEIRFR